MMDVSEVNSEGYWGPVTSNIDWCEANYEVTYLIAEFWNTVSNLVMLLLPLIGILYGLKDGMEFRYILSFLSIMVVGTGSTLFHSTMLYECQLLDELPMVWGSAVFLYTLKETRSPPKTTNLPLIALLSSLCILVTLVYVIFNKPIIFQATYGLMNLFTIYYCLKLIRINKRALHLFTISLVSYGCGVIIWSLDNLYCDNLRSVRRGVGHPLKPVFQGHAWWHILAGIGTYVSILFSVNARVSFLKQDPYIYKQMGLPTAVRFHVKQY